MTKVDQNESLNTQVMREKSAVREVSLPRELANRLVSLSKADISQVNILFCQDLSNGLKCYFHLADISVYINYFLAGAETKLCGLGCQWSPESR